jgi:hypothetical protein
VRNDASGARPASYAVVWREPDGTVCSGELELGRHRLRLEGISRNGRPRSHEIRYADLASARIGRAVRERIDGRSTLVLEAGELRLNVASAVGVGMIHEMAERLQALMSHGVPT